MASQKERSNGLSFAIVWHGALAAIIAAGVIGAWSATGQLAALTASVQSLERGFEKFDDRLRDVERGRYKTSLGDPR